MDEGPEQDQAHTGGQAYQETVVKPAKRLAAMLDAMTDPAQVDVAEQVIRDVHKELPEVWLGGRQRYVLVEAITKALTQAHAAGRREGLDLAVKIADMIRAKAKEVRQ